MPHTAPYRTAIGTIALIVFTGTTTARAEDASPWKEELHAAARLISGAAGTSDETILRAGVEIRLEAGWHTYWRYPGDSGVPPTFDFAGSRNVKTVTVLWPAPERFADGAGGYSIGYVNDVVFPLRVTPTDVTKSTMLHLKLGYAFCKEACFPAEANLDLALAGGDSSEEPLLVASEARVPRRLLLGAGTGIVIRSVRREKAGGRQRVIVNVAAPERTPVDLFVEGPTANWALPLPDPIAPALGSATDVRTFWFDLDGLPPGAHADGATLTFTAVSPDNAIEVGVPLY